MHMTNSESAAELSRAPVPRTRMVYEVMTSDGVLHKVIPSALVAATDGDTIAYNGETYRLYATPASDTSAYAKCEINTSHLTIPLPLPLGKMLYPAPLLWRSQSGITTFLTSTTFVKKRRASGVFLSWEDSDEELSDPEDIAMPEESEESEGDDADAEDIDSDVEEVSDVEDDIVPE